MPKVNIASIILNFLPYLWKDKSIKLRLCVIAALALIPITITINLVLPAILKQIIDAINHKITSTESIILTLIISYSLLWTTEKFSTKLRELVFFRPICHAITDYSMAVFRHLQELNLQFHLGRETGRITTAIDSCQRAIYVVITNAIFRIIPTVVEIIFAFLILGYLYGSYYITVLAITLSIFIVIMYRLDKILDKFGEEWNKHDGYGISKFIDSLLNIETVKYFNRTDYEIKSAINLNVIISNMAIRNMLVVRSMQISLNCIIAVGFGFIVYHAAVAVQTNQLILGDFVLISSYVILFIAPMNELAMMISDSIYYATKIYPAASILADKTELEIDLDKANLQVTNADIVFDRVSFSYLPELPILNNLSFEVPAGSTIAIVGPSGCGKSTITRLLLRLFDPKSGNIKIDNQIIEQCNPYSVRQTIACVPQDIALFNNTLRFNICYGSFDSTDKEIEDILRITALDQFIKKLPDGLNTQVGERGLKLSGGERQRIALARALLRRTKILILDEATSSLDVNTEREINNNIAIVSHSITTIIIAHRLSTIVNADNIIVLNQGTVAEQGTHDALLKQDGLYTALWQSQLERPMQDIEI